MNTHFQILLASVALFLISIPSFLKQQKYFFWVAQNHQRQDVKDIMLFSKVWYYANGVVWFVSLLIGSWTWFGAYIFGSIVHIFIAKSVQKKLDSLMETKS